VFNKPGNFKFWNDECVAFNYRWSSAIFCLSNMMFLMYCLSVVCRLTEELGVNPDEITFIEDVWAGGGNLGPSIE
jgi:alanyl-tRNA synthetase